MAGAKVDDVCLEAIEQTVLALLQRVEKLEKINGYVQHQLDEVGCKRDSLRNTVTTAILSPCERASSRPTIQEAIDYACSRMAKRLPNKTPWDDFLRDLQQRGLNPRSAEKLLNRLLDEGSVGYDTDGWLVKG